MAKSLNIWRSFQNPSWCADHSFWADDANSQSVFLVLPDNVREESSCRVGHPYTTIQNRLKSWFTFICKWKWVHMSQSHYYSQQFLFSQLFEDNMSSKPGFCVGSFYDGCVFQYSGLKSFQNTCIWDAENPREIKQHQLRSAKSCGLGAGPAIGVLGPYCVTIEGMKKTITIKWKTLPSY